MLLFCFCWWCLRFPDRPEKPQASVAILAQTSQAPCLCSLLACASCTRTLSFFRRAMSSAAQLFVLAGTSDLAALLQLAFGQALARTPLAFGQALARTPLAPGPVSAVQVAAAAAVPVAGAAGVCTTLVLRNVPEEIFTALLVDELRRSGIEADFVLVCVDPRYHLNTGYAYVNLRDGNSARELITWHGRDMLAGRWCSQGGARRQLSVAYAAKQGFDICVTMNGRKQLHDPRLRAWVLPARATRRLEIEASMHEVRTRAVTTPARTPAAAEQLHRGGHVLQPGLVPDGVAAAPVASSHPAREVYGLRSEGVASSSP